MGDAMDSINLSKAALSLLRLHVAHAGKIAVDASNREAYRELAKAGLMVAGHTFTGGREVFYDFTEIGWKFANITDAPWNEEAAALRE